MAAHPVSARIAAKYAPAVVAELKAHHDDLTAQFGALERMAINRYWDALMAAVPHALTQAVNGFLDSEGVTTVEQILERQFP